MDWVLAGLRYTPIRLALALAWSLLLCVLLLQGEADPLIDLGLPRGDNTLLRELAFSTLHLLIFGATCLCWNWALPQTLGARLRLAAACFITIALGVSTEILQGFTLDRHASWLDLVANISGALIGAKLIWLWHESL